MASGSTDTERAVFCAICYEEAIHLRCMDCVQAEIWLDYGDWFCRDCEAAIDDSSSDEDFEDVSEQ